MDAIFVTNRPDAHRVKCNNKISTQVFIFRLFSSCFKQIDSDNGKNINDAYPGAVGLFPVHVLKSSFGHPVSRRGIRRVPLKLRTTYHTPKRVELNQGKTGETKVLWQICHGCSQLLLCLCYYKCKFKAAEWSSWYHFSNSQIVVKYY